MHARVRMSGRPGRVLEENGCRAFMFDHLAAWVKPIACRCAPAAQFRLAFGLIVYFVSRSPVHGPRATLPTPSDSPFERGRVRVLVPASPRLPGPRSPVPGPRFPLPLPRLLLAFQGLICYSPALLNT